MKRLALNPIPTVALVGRTNVGKSTLFNRLIGERKALTSDISGTTRTRNIGTTYWRAMPMTVVDTGGLTYEKNLPFEEQVIAQAERAIADADAVVFVLDVQTGILPQERALAKRLQKLKKPIILVANKADSTKWRNASLEENWGALGFGTRPMLISAANGSGIGDMLEAVYNALPAPYHEQQQQEDAPKPREDEPVVAQVAIIGRPNVGKSSLLNALAGSDEVIVSEIAHTTRESFDIDVVHEEKRYRIIDTAGIRRKNRVERGLEKMGVNTAIETLERTDVVLFVLDATEPFSMQEKHLVNLIESRQCGVIIIVNKWDLIEDREQENRTAFIKAINRYYPFLTWAPIIFVSAKSGFRVHQIFDMIDVVANARRKVVDQEALEDWWKEVVRRHLPTRGKGTKHPQVLALKQVATEPPTFEVTIKYNTSLHQSYLNFLENELRETFEFVGTPAILYVRKYKK